MWARYNKATRQVRHWSEPPFTNLPEADEADQEFPSGTKLPGPIKETVLSLDLSKLEHDPSLAPPPSPPSKHKGKRVSQMSKPDMDELLEAIAQRLGLADENGVIK